MNYTIASFEEVQGNCQMDLEKDGNKYQIYFTDGTESKFRKFDSIDEAFKKFTEMSEYMVKGLYSNKDRMKLLMEG